MEIPHLRVGIIGDSISVTGAGPSGIAHYPWWHYLMRVQAAAGAPWDVTCVAVGGERVIDHFAVQLDELLQLDTPPEVILAMGGINDIAAGYTPEQIQAAMAALTAVANDADIELYWMQPPGVVGMPDVFGDLAWDYTHGVPVDLDNYLEEIGDHVHPMGRMHADMAFGFFEALPQ